MTALLALATVLCWGAWIPTAQARPGVRQLTRTLYAAAGNLALAAVAFLAAHRGLPLGWRGFWLPVAGGVMWTAGSLFAFRATHVIGLARAAGTWTPLNIVTSFAWGAALFGELSGLSVARWAALAGGSVLVGIGLTMILRSQDAGSPGRPSGLGDGPVTTGRGGTTYRAAVSYAVGAGLLWGTYFVPAQWAKVPAEIANLPLAIGIFAAALAGSIARRAPARLAPPTAAVQLGAGVLFGAGNLALLALVARIGTGTGFTVAQLSLLVNASIGVWVFKLPAPGTRAARLVLAGVAVAGTGGALIGALR